MTKIYRGAILEDQSDAWDPDGSDKWTLTNDADKLLDPDADIIWASTIEQLQDELEQRYPCDHPGLSRVRKRPSYCDSDHLSLYAYPYPYVDSTDPVQIADIAKRVGTVSLARTHDLHRLRWDKRFDNYCTLRFASGGAVIVTYDAKRRQRRQTVKSLPVMDMQRTLHNLRTYTWGELPQADIDGNSYRSLWLGAIMRTLWLLERLYGKGSFHYLKDWHKFVKLWRDHQAATEKVLTKDAGDHDKDFVASFIAFMTKEVKRKLPKAEDDTTFKKRLTPITVPK